MIERIPDEKLRTFREYDGHESVYKVHDPQSGLIAFIGIHSRALGPATGGTRYYSYDSEDNAIRDALNLSRAMTAKCALASVPFGGGKGVIMMPRDISKKKELLREYARAVNSLGGMFSTGEDVGIGEEDIREMARISRHINGLPEGAGDPSPWAAKSVFVALLAALRFANGNDNLTGLTVGVKGVGKVGGELVRLLAYRGARITIADTDSSAAEKLASLFPAIRIVHPEEIHTLPFDIYAPCAMGGEFTEERARELNSRIVCGAANNQLTSPEIGRFLFDKGVVYVPDYVANAGGLINVVAPLYTRYSRTAVKRKVDDVARTVTRLLALSRRDGRPTSDIADALVAETIRMR